MSRQRIHSEWERWLYILRVSLKSFMEVAAVLTQVVHSEHTKFRAEIGKALSELLLDEERRRD